MCDCFIDVAAYEPAGIDNKANPANIYSAEILASNTSFCFSQFYQLQQKGIATGQNNVAYLADPSCTDLLVFGDFIPNRKYLITLHKVFNLLISPPFFLVQVLCASLTQPLGCCYSTLITMLAQNQLNASALLLFSPCFLRYMSQSCPGSSTNAFCTAGALGNMTTITGVLLEVNRCFLIFCLCLQQLRP